MGLRDLLRHPRRDAEVREAVDRWLHRWGPAGRADRATARAGTPRERDVPTDPAVANTRATGGQPDPDQPDQHSSTGTTPTEGFVGRVGGADVGYADETGAERRAEQDRIEQDRIEDRAEQDRWAGRDQDRQAGR